MKHEAMYVATVLKILGLLHVKKEEYDMMLSIGLVAVFNEKNEVLLLRRKADVHCPDVWSFPGGKHEIGESAKETAMRELQEETNITVTDLAIIGEYNHLYADRLLQFTLFSALLPNQTIIAAESDVLWYNIFKLSDLEMPDANQMLCSMLESYVLQKENPPARG